MHASAIILVSDKRPRNPFLSYSQMDWSGLSPSATLARSLARVEIFGQSVLERTVARYKKDGLRNITVIAASGCMSVQETKEVGIKEVRIAIPEPAEDRWARVKRVLLKDVQRGIDTVLIAEMGAYADLDLAAALRFHREKAQPVTPIHDAEGSLSYWLVDAGRVLSKREFSLPPDEERTIATAVPYTVQGYVNRLCDERDFRRLVVDAFFGRCSIAPAGRQVKPGVWLDEGANLRKTARLVAPSYVGCHTRVQMGAVIARCSNIERNCNVGEGSLVYDASLLPQTMIGRGLDVSTALVEGNDFIHLGRKVALRINDANLISSVPPVKQHVPVYLPEYEEPSRLTRDRDSEYSEYLSRAKGRLLGAFRSEVL